MQAAVVEGEIPRIERFPGSDALAKFSGIAPIERSSGTRTKHQHKRYGNRRLNRAFYMLALHQIRRAPSGRPYCPAARIYYDRKLSEGKSKKAALRCLMRPVVDIVYAMMRDRTPYRHLNWMVRR